MKGMPYKKTTSSMVNSFVLNSMEFASALLNLMDFNYAMLTGMYERVISEKEGMSEIELNSMKINRRTNIDGGFGPGRRKRRY